MTRPWQELDAVDTEEGRLLLLKRADTDFLITVDGRVLMNSKANRSELILAEEACIALSSHPAPRVLIGGLGMGCTLRAALDNLPENAKVQVDELNPVVIEWCKGPLKDLTENAVSDPRVNVEITDVVKSIQKAAESKTKYDAIILDLYQGPTEAEAKIGKPFFGEAALGRTHKALSKGGIFAVWGEDPDQAFDRRLKNCGFTARSFRPKSGARRHTIWLAKKR